MSNYVTREEILREIELLLKKVEGDNGEQIRKYIESKKYKPYIELSLIAATLRGLIR